MKSNLPHSTIPRALGDRAAPASGEKPIVFVVDDDPMIASLIGTILEGAGYRVRTADGGLDAMAQAKISPPDLLLVDLTMPQLSGAETMARMRVSQPSLPTLVVSGVSSEEARAEAPEASAFLEKPFKFEALLHAVAALITGPLRA